MHSKLPSSLLLAELRNPPFLGKVVVLVVANLPLSVLVLLCNPLLFDFVIIEEVEPLACSPLPCLSSDVVMGEASCMLSCGGSSFFAAALKGNDCMGGGGGVGMGNTLVVEMWTRVTRGLVGTRGGRFKVGCGVMRTGG